MVCEALRSKPKVINTRLGTFGEVFYALAPNAVDRILLRRLPRLPRLRRRARREERRGARLRRADRDGHAHARGPLVAGRAGDRTRAALGLLAALVRRPAGASRSRSGISDLSDVRGASAADQPVIGAGAAIVLQGDADSVVSEQRAGSLRAQSLRTAGDRQHDQDDDRLRGDHPCERRPCPDGAALRRLSRRDGGRARAGPEADGERPAQGDVATQRRRRRAHAGGGSGRLDRAASWAG